VEQKEQDKQDDKKNVLHNRKTGKRVKKTCQEIWLEGIGNLEKGLRQGV
jgi:hypothetical protein